MTVLPNPCLCPSGLNPHPAYVYFVCLGIRGSQPLGMLLSRARMRPFWPASTLKCFPNQTGSQHAKTISAPTAASEPATRGLFHGIQIAFFRSGGCGFRRPNMVKTRAHRGLPLGMQHYFARKRSIASRVTTFDCAESWKIRTFASGCSR